MNLADSDVFVKFKKLWLENNQKFAKVPDQGIVKKKRRAYWGRQGPRLTLKKSGGRTKYLKSGISTLTADISAKCHCFHKSGAFLELPMHEFSESVEKLKKNSLT